MEDNMQDSRFEIDQVSKLREIERARIKRGEPGLRTEIQALIMRLQSGGVGPKSDDPREVQAKRLWDKGFGRDVDSEAYAYIDDFDSYLRSIPEIPESLTAHDDRFPEIILVDARLGIVKICEILDIEYDGTDQTFEDFDPKKARTEKVYWIRLQDGKKNRNKSVRTCRSEFAKDELGLTVHEGLARFAQNPESFRSFALDLAGSVYRDDRDYAAYLNWFNDRPLLYWYFDENENSHCGSGSRRE